MPAMDTVLCDNPEVKGLLLETLRECTDLQEFGRRMLELVVNAAMSARADEVCNASWGERTPERPEPTEAEVRAAREAVRRIIESAIGPKEDEG